MTSNECAMFKVFLKTNDVTEVKKFVVDDSSVITSYVFMKEKLQTLFPKLRESSFRITWRDCEGDDVIIDNDEDLILAFTEMEDSLKILYVTVLPYSYNTQQSNTPQYASVPSRIICDSCNNEITTYRYKCLQCFDYDLCGKCEHDGHHAHHMMLRTSTPELPLARCGRKMFEHVNKAVKKANHMAYKQECKKRSKWDKKKCDGSDAEEGESCRKDAPKSAECPFEAYVQPFYPIIDALSNAANTAANAAAQAATSAAAPTGESGAQPNAPPQANSSTSGQTFSPHDVNNSTSQFMEVIRNALSGVFVQQPHSQQATQPTTGQTQSQSNQPTATPNAPRVAPDEIDLLTAPEPMDISSTQREPGWTMLSPEEIASQPQRPTLIPVLTPQEYIQQQQPQSQQQQQPPSHQLQQPPSQQQQQPPSQQQPQQQQQHSQQHVQYPVLNVPAFLAAQQQDPHIAEGLRQLLEMGFSDEQALTTLLKRFNANVDEVIRHIFEHK